MPAGELDEQGQEDDRGARVVRELQVLREEAAGRLGPLGEQEVTQDARKGGPRPPQDAEEQSADDQAVKDDGKDGSPRNGQ